jgi:hypothetical protein
LNGFTGPVNLSCPTGGTIPPAGYSCAIASSVTVGSTAVTTPLNLTLVTAATGAMKAAAVKVSTWSWGTISFAGGVVVLLSLALGGLGGMQSARNFVSLGGLVLCASSFVLGCGGGGGGGSSGPVPTTTTIASSSPKVGFGVPLQLTVTVDADVTPTGNVQLYDNGQAYGSAATVSAGIAIYRTTNLPAGVHVITASYLGNATTQPSNSAPITQVVTGSVPVQVTATSSGGITHTTNLTIIVN